MIQAQISESYELRNERLNFVPAQLKRNLPLVSAASELQVKLIARSSSTMEIPLWRFSSEQFALLSSMPVSVKVSRGETHYFAENDNLWLYATGESRDEAIDAFCDLLVHFYKHYKELDWNSVTGKARRLKEIYEERFSEIRK